MAVRVVDAAEDKVVINFYFSDFDGFGVINAVMNKFQEKE